MIKSSRLVILFVLVQIVFHQEVVALSADPEFYLIQDHLNQVEDWMKPDIDPCTNFIDYSCGNFHKWAKTSTAKTPNQMTLEWILENGLKFSSLDIKIKLFRESCIKHYEKNIRVLFENYKMWPASEVNWNPDKIDWIYNYGENYDTSGIPIVLSIINETRTPKIIIFPVFDINTFPFEISTDEEKEDVQMTLISFGASEENAQIWTNEMVEFSKKMNAIKEITANENWLMETTVDNLKCEYPGINWEKLIYNMKDPNTPVLMIDQIRMKEYLKLTSENPIKAYNYFIWETVKKMGSSLCNEKTIKYFRPIIFLKVFNENINLNVLEKIRLIAIKTAQIKGFKSVEEIEEKTRQLEKLFVARMFTQEATGFEMLTAILGDTFKDTEIDVNNYQKNVKSVVESWKRSGLNLELVYDIYYMNVSMPKSPNPLTLFGRTRNHDYMSETLMFLALIHNKPTYRLFPLLFENVFMSGIKYDGNNIFNYVTSKLLKFCKDESNDTDSSTKSNQLENLETPPAVPVQMKKILKQYDNFLRENQNACYFKKISYEMKLTPRKLFFIEFAQNLCGIDEIDQVGIIKVLSIMDDFAKEFNCPVGSPMNFQGKCYEI